MSICYEPFFDFDRFFNEPFGRQGQGWPLGLSTSIGDYQRHVALVVPGGNDHGSILSYQAAKPRVILHEDSANNVVVSFELPGMKKEDLRIDIINGRLTVFEVAENHGGERGYAIREGGLFSRTLQLPHGVKEDEIKAAMENGVLTVTFPKADKEVEPRRITIA